MDDVGKACVLICWVMRSANLADRLNLPLSMLDVGLPGDIRRNTELAAVLLMSVVRPKGKTLHDQVQQRSNIMVIDHHPVVFLEHGAGPK